MWAASVGSLVGVREALGRSRTRIGLVIVVWLVANGPSVPVALLSSIPGSDLVRDVVRYLSHHRVVRRDPRDCGQEGREL